MACLINVFEMGSIQRWSPVQYKARDTRCIHNNRNNGQPTVNVTICQNSQHDTLRATSVNLVGATGLLCSPWQRACIAAT
jgi:hypothetical protein